MVQAGIFGGAGRGQGRKPKNRTAGEDVAELAAKESAAIKRAFSEGLRSDNERTRILAAKELLAEERRERELEEDIALLRALPRRELDARLLEIVGEAFGLDLSDFAGEIIDAEVAEDPAELEPPRD